jgi:hypothetical protein
MMICLGEDPDSVKSGKKTVAQLMREYVKQRDLPIHVTEEVHLTMSPKTAESQRAELGKRPLLKPLISRFDKLPLMLDSRVPDNVAYVVIPAIGEHRQTVVELDLVSGRGADIAMRELRLYEHRKYEEAKANLAKVPAAFRKPPGAQGKGRARQTRPNPR